MLEWLILGQARSILEPKCLDREVVLEAVGGVVVVWHRPITGSEVPGNIGAPFAVPLREQKVGGMPPQRLAP